MNTKKAAILSGRIAIMLFVFIFMVGQPLSSWASHTQIQEKREQLDRIDGKQEQVQEKIRTLKYKESLLILEIRALDRRLSDMQSEINVIQNDLDATTEQRRKTEERLVMLNDILREKTRELEALTREVQKDQEILERRMVDSYKYGEVSYLEVLLNSEDFTDFLNRFYLLRQIVKSDKELLIRMEAAREATIQKKREVEMEQVRLAELRRQVLAEEQRIAALKKVKKQKKDAVSWEAGQKDRLFQKIRLDRYRQQQYENTLKSEEDKLEADIRRLQSSSSSPRRGNGKFSWPVVGRISSEFGYRRHPITGRTRLHAGLDIAAPYGTPIRAAESGTVILSGYSGGYGNRVVVDHGGGYTTLYAHASSLLVSTGQNVSVGQEIARVGSTGMSTGNHLHFEVRVSGSPRNPRLYL